MQYLLTPEEYDKLKIDHDSFEQRVSKECAVRVAGWHGAIVAKLGRLRPDLMTGRDACEAFIKITEETKP